MIGYSVVPGLDCSSLATLISFVFGGSDHGGPTFCCSTLYQQLAVDPEIKLSRNYRWGTSTKMAVSEDRCWFRYGVRKLTPRLLCMFSHNEQQEQANSNNHLWRIDSWTQLPWNWRNNVRFVNCILDFFSFFRYWVRSLIKPCEFENPLDKRLFGFRGLGNSVALVIVSLFPDVEIAKTVKLMQICSLIPFDSWFPGNKWRLDRTQTEAARDRGEITALLCDGTTPDVTALSNLHTRHDVDWH